MVYIFQSTFIRQMQILHSGSEDGNWSDEEKILYKYVLRSRYFHATAPLQDTNNLIHAQT